jgi:hypothetical protein
VNIGASSCRLCRLCSEHISLMNGTLDNLLLIRVETIGQVLVQMWLFLLQAY